MSEIDSYFVKPGYHVNHGAKTLEDFGGEYWTSERLASAVEFQYHVYLQAANLARKKKSKRVLDLGCGPAVKTKSLLLPVLRDVYLVDQPNCEGVAKAAIPTAKFIAADLEKCDLNLGTEFDLIVCADVLEHLVNPVPCMKFAYNHLSPSGVAVFSTPERDVLRGLSCMESPNEAHVREWNGDEFRRLLEYQGFKIVKHSLVPQKRLSKFEDFGRRAAMGLVRPKRWASCQMAVCTI